MKTLPGLLRPAVVLSCIGGEETALNVTRALGKQGVPVIVVSEDNAKPAAAYSRYCIQHVVAAPFSSCPEGLRGVLIELGRRFGPGLPVFPTADPDLEALNDVGPALRPAVASTLGSAALIRQLIDKRLFAALARECELPVPATWEPADRDALLRIADEANFPLIAKPSYPFNWSPALAQAFSGRKARILSSRSELETLALALDARAPGVLVQQCITGPDDLHYDVHAFLDNAGSPQAVFTGRKWRIQPPHAGSGAFIEAVSEPALEQSTVSMLQRIGFTGIANVNYKRDPATGQFLLIEVNARVSQWSSFPASLGVNLVWHAYAEAAGLPAPPAPRPFRAGRYFVDMQNDLRAIRTYLKEGEWTWGSYLASLAKVRHFQVFDSVDLRPWVRLCCMKLGSLLRRLARA